MGMDPPLLIPAEFLKVQAQFTAQAYLAAAIGYLHGKYPKGGPDFVKQLKINNYVLFAGKDSDSVNADAVLMNMTGAVRDTAVQEAIQAATKFLAAKVAPSVVDWIPVVGTVWGIGKGAWDGATEAQAMGRSAVKYYRGGFGDFIFDPYTGTITKYNGKDKAVKIPKLVNDKQVLIIGEKAFENNKAIESVTLEDVNTRTIKSGAFAGCSSLKTVSFPQNQTQMKIEPDAFNGTSLSEVVKTKLRGFGYMGAGVGAAAVTVTFNSNGGSAPNPANKTVKVSEIYGAMPTVTRSGYKFDGWYNAEGGKLKPDGSDKFSGRIPNS